MNYNSLCLFDEILKSPRFFQIIYCKLHLFVNKPVTLNSYTYVANGSYIFSCWVL